MSKQVKTFFPAKVKVGTKETDWVCEMIQCPGDCGEYVLESDYAALAAENERLQGNLAGRDAMIMGRDSIIKCRDEEIERLRKLLEMYLKADPLIGESVASEMLAAKEGDRK